jgi:hypothetical protein
MAQASGAPEPRGPLLTRFEVDPRDERMFARVRAGAAFLAAAGSGLLLLGDLPVPVFMVGLLGLFVSLVWLRQARRAAHRVTHAGNHFLAVHRDGLLLAEGERRVAVLWTQVQAVEVDEERLDVVVTRHDAPPLHIEPRYGVEIHQLVRTLRNAWQGRGDS